MVSSIFCPNHLSMLIWKKPVASIESVKEGTMEIMIMVIVNFVLRPDPHMPLFFSIYALTSVLATRKINSKIKRRLIFKTITISLFSSMGRNFLKNGRCVSRYKKTPKINRIRVINSDSFLYFMLGYYTSSRQGNKVYLSVFLIPFPVRVEKTPAAAGAQTDVVYVSNAFALQKVDVCPFYVQKQGVICLFKDGIRKTFIHKNFLHVGFYLIATWTDRRTYKYNYFSNIYPEFWHFFKRLFRNLFCSATPARMYYRSCRIIRFT